MFIQKQLVKSIVVSCSVSRVASQRNHVSVSKGGLTFPIKRSGSGKAPINKCAVPCHRLLRVDFGFEKQLNLGGFVCFLLPVSWISDKPGWHRSFPIQFSWREPLLRLSAFGWIFELFGPVKGRPFPHPSAAVSRFQIGGFSGALISSQLKTFDIFKHNSVQCLLQPYFSTAGNGSIFRFQAIDVHRAVSFSVHLWG